MKNILSIAFLTLLFLVLGLIAFSSAPNIFGVSPRPAPVMSASHQANEAADQAISVGSERKMAKAGEAGPSQVVTPAEPIPLLPFPATAESSEEVPVTEVNDLDPNAQSTPVPLPQLQPADDLADVSSETKREQREKDLQSEQAISATVRFSQSSYNVPLGGSIVADLVVDDAEYLAAWETVLLFDSAYLNVPAITEGEFLKSTGRTTAVLGPLQEDAGLAAIGGYSYGEPAGVSGSGVLANITFEGLVEGETTVELTDLLLATDNAGLASVQATTGLSTTITIGAVGIYTQSIPLEGWTMISSYIQPDDPQIANVLAPVAGELVLAKNGAGLVYWPEFSVDQIEQWSVADGYQLYVKQTSTLTISGAIVDPGTTPIDLIPGWNLAAYLRATPHPVGDALASISSELVLVKDGDGLVYWPDLEIDQIGNMQPGKGYQMYLNNPDVLVYPAN